MMEKSRITTQVLATLLASISLLNGGFHMGWSSPSLAKLQAEDSDLPVTSDQGAWIVSVFSLSCAIGAIIAAPVVNRWGRKVSLLSTAVPYALGCILIGVAQNYWWLIIARFFASLGYGMTTTVLPMYTGEIASDRVRGALGVLLNQMMNIGILLAYCVGPWVSRVALAGLGLALPIIFALTFFWMPESPYFLTMKKKQEAAEKSLTWFRGTSDVEEELRKIEENTEKEQSGSFKELITTPGNLKLLMISTILVMAPQLSGTTAILSYTSLIFEMSGSEMNSSISTIIIGIVQFLSGVLSVFTVDSVGRRPLLMLSFCGSIIFLTAEALYFQFKAIGTDVSSISWLPVTAIIGYVVFYNIGLGCLPFTILSEILPYNLKPVAMMYAITVIALTSAAVTKLYQVLADAYGIQVSFYLFAGCSIFAAIFSYFILPETKQRSLGDIQDEFQKSKDCETAIRPSKI